MSFRIPDNLLVEGIHEIGPVAVANHSHLLLPKSFDRKKYAAKWSFVGASAEAAQLPQRLVEGYMVNGWAVYKDPDDENKTVTRPLGGKQAILLFRPRVLQDAVNAIFGNVSKERTIAEQQGRTVQGQAVPAGLLPEKQLKGYDPSAEAEEPIGYTFNKIPAAKAASMGGRGQVSSKIKSRKA